jgi:hypothetical protein
MNNVQDVLQLIMKTDVRLLACLAGLLIVLLFWRVFHRTARIDREIVRLNERFERIREEVRTLGRKPLLAVVPPAGAEHAEAGTTNENSVAEEPPVEDNFFFSADTEDSADTEESRASVGEEPFETKSFSFSSEGAEDIEEAEEMPNEPGFEEAADEPDQLDLSEEAPDGKAWVKTSSVETTAGFEETTADADQAEEEPAADSWMETFSAEPAATESEEEPAEEEFEETTADAGQAEEEPDSWMETFSAEPAGEEPEETPAEPVTGETSAESDLSEEESAMNAWMSPACNLPGPAESEEPSAGSDIEAPTVAGPAPSEEEPAAEEPSEPAAGPNIIRLGDDPNRPEIRLARCLACNYKLAYPDRLSGKRIRCPSCKSEHVLP